MIDVRQRSPVVYVAQGGCGAPAPADTVSSMKTCSKCGESKPLDKFNLDRFKPLGRKARCKDCNNEYLRARHATNPAVAKSENERKKAWKAKNVDLCLQMQRDWRARNHAHCVAQSKEWHAKNKERDRTLSKTYRALNGEQLRTKSAQWAADNPERVRVLKNKATADLTDYYIRTVLRLRKEDAPQWLIEKKREQLTLQRLTRQLVQEVDKQLEYENGN